MYRTRLALILLCTLLAVASTLGSSSIAMADANVSGDVAVPAAPMVEVTSNRLNVRSNPSTTGRVLGSLQRGQRVMAPGEIEDGWLFVRSDDGVTGWVAAKFVRSVKASPAAPSGSKP